MNHERSYMVREFARLAGVTVRTLHFYDREGLLKPTQRTGKRHRLYMQRDLLRLQQILTLKYLGFSLKEIHTLLDAPTYDVTRALRSQQQAIEQRITELQQAAQALERTLKTVEAGESVDWQTIRLIIAGVVAEQKQAWLQAYFTPEQLAQFEAQAVNYTPAMALEGARQWQALSEAFNAKRHLPPAHPDVQTLAADMERLIQGVTRGDPAIEAAIRRMYEDDQIPEEITLIEPELHRFMGTAYDLYKQAQTKPSAT